MIGHHSHVLGTSGNPVRIITNFFKLESAPDWNLYQYRIDFSPTIMSTGLRHILVNKQSNTLGVIKCFDCDSLYLPIKLPNEVRFIVLSLSSIHNHNNMVPHIVCNGRSVGDGKSPKF